MYTVNNKKARSIKGYTSCFFLLSILQTSLFAQKINKFYVSSIQDSGILYFIEPDFVFGNEFKSNLEYDLTYLSSNDSIILNFSLFHKEILRIDTLTFELPDHSSIKSTTKKIYINSSKNTWIHRYSSKFSYDELVILHTINIPPKIIVSAKNDTVELSIPIYKWQKKSAIINKIFQLTEANR